LQATPNASPTGLSIIDEDMRQVDQVIAKRLDSGVPLVGSVSHYISSNRAGRSRLPPAVMM